MSGFSSRASGVIGDFAASLGLALSQPARDGSYSFAFQQSGLLTFTPSTDGRRVLMSLARRPTRMDEAMEQRAVAAAGYDATAGRMLHTGLAPDGSLLAILDLDDQELDLPTIESAFRTLNARHPAL